MPFKSRAQQRRFHANPPLGISKAKVHEYDEATKGQAGGFAALPEKAVQATASKAARKAAHAGRK